MNVHIRFFHPSTIGRLFRMPLHDSDLDYFVMDSIRLLLYLLTSVYWRDNFDIQTQNISRYSRIKFLTSSILFGSRILFSRSRKGCEVRRYSVRSLEVQYCFCEFFCLRKLTLTSSSVLRLSIPTNSGTKSRSLTQISTIALDFWYGNCTVVFDISYFVRTKSTLKHRMLFLYCFKKQLRPFSSTNWRFMHVLLLAVSNIPTALMYFSQ